jgi:hypothetical protein
MPSLTNKLYEFTCPSCGRIRTLKYKTYWYAKKYSKYCNICKPRVTSHLIKGGWNKGLKMSKEWSNRLSTLHKNNKYWVGKKHKEDSKIKQRLAKLNKRGSLANNWRGGLTEISKRIRGQDEYKLWRSAVFERDKFTCIWCGQVGGKLNADHIKPFALYPELRFAIDNGRTLCIECHRKTSTYGGRTR